MTFYSALLLGLLASAHCAGMCGGLQSALQQPTVIRSRVQALQHLIALNTGRLFIYVCGGILLAVLGVSLQAMINVPETVRIARILTATVLLLFGIQLLVSNSRPFSQIELIGAGIWRKLSGTIRPGTNTHISRSFQLGLIWGFLPCGLVYGVLATTLFADNGLQGGLIMLGFGLGTLPAMVLTGGLYQQLRRAIQHRGVRLVGAIIFIQGGILMILAPWFTDTGFMASYPQIMSGMFCLS